MMRALSVLTATRRRIGILIAIVLVAFVGLLAVAFYLGDSYALRSLTVRQATPTALAAAMRGDHFYSDYREDTLLVSGAIVSVSQSGGATTVEFLTHDTFTLQCEMSTPPGPLHRDEVITVITEALRASRLPSGVLLDACVIVG